MPTIQHSVLSGADLHEPKGISGASSNSVYVANGSGSGAWGRAFSTGWESYTGTNTPVSLSYDGWTTLINNAGSSDSTYRLSGYNAVWSPSNGYFDWSLAGLQEGDVVDLQFIFEVTTAAIDQVFKVRANLGESTPTESLVVFSEKFYPEADTYKFSESFSVFIENSDILNSSTKIEAYTKGAGNTASLKKIFARVSPARVVYA